MGLKLDGSSEYDADMWRDTLGEDSGIPLYTHSLLFEVLRAICLKKVLKFDHFKTKIFIFKYFPTFSSNKLNAFFLSYFDSDHPTRAPPILSYHQTIVQWTASFRVDQMCTSLPFNVADPDPIFKSIWIQYFFF